MSEFGEWHTPRGRSAWMFTRDDTNDFNVCASIMIEDEYGLAALSLSGHALDIGAHIGAATMALALDNPELRVTAVEVVPENIDVLRQNLDRNGIADRVTVVHAAAGGPDEASRTCSMRHRSHPAVTDAYAAASRYIANTMWAAGEVPDADVVEMPCVSLADLTAGGPVSFVKIDCEGAEWEFFRDPALADVAMVTGEYHWDYRWQGDAAVRKARSPKRPPRADSPQAELHRLFDATHALAAWDHPTLGHFTAVRR